MSKAFDRRICNKNIMMAWYDVTCDSHYGMGNACVESINASHG